MADYDFKLPSEVLQILAKFLDAGFEISIVGGAVRDLLSGKKVGDWDMTTNATPQRIQKLFPQSFYDNKFGTVGLETKIGIIEVTTYRTEHGYVDRRHPQKITWGANLEEDLKRRDFTVNALALKFEKSGPPKLIDLFEGKADLAGRAVRAVGDPAQRFSEDALRMLRGVRIAVELDFQIEEQTRDAISKNASHLGEISGERIRDEVFKILSVPDSQKAYEGVELLKGTGLLGEILPEIELGFGIEQKSVGRHHIYDVGTHNLFALKFCPSQKPLVRLATLLHDVGKPKVVGQDEKGTVTFYNHEVVGAEMASTIADRWHLSKKDKLKLVTLVRWHQFTVDEFQTDKAIRRFIARVGLDNIEDMMDLRIGDRLGSGIPEERKESWRLKKFRERIKEVLKKPFTVADLKIDGNDVMKVLNLKPGPKVGEVLNALFEEVVEDTKKNNREYLLGRLKEIS